MVYGLSTIVARLLNFVLTPLFVSRFPVTIYGVFTNLYTWAALWNAILAFGMETTYFRFLQKHADNPQKVYRNSFAVIFYLSALFLATVFLFLDPIAKLLANSLGQNAAFSDFKLYVAFFAIFLAADAWAVIPFARLRAEGRPLRFMLVKVLNILTFVFLNLVFILFLPYCAENGWLTWMQLDSWFRAGWLGYVFIANLVASGVTLALLLPEFGRLSLRLDAVLLRSMIRYSLPILIANISFIINELIDKMVLIPWLVPKDIAARDLGIYGAVSKIAVFLSIAVQGFRLGAEPFFFSYAKNQNARKTYAIIMEYFVILMVWAMVGLTVNLEWLKYFIMGKDTFDQEVIWSGLRIVPVLLLGYVFLGIYMNLSIWYKLSDQTRFALYISGIGAVFTIGLNILFLPQFSYVAAAWITMFSYFLMAVFSYLWGQKHYPIPYRFTKILFYIGIGSFLSWLSFSIFEGHLFWGNMLLLVFIAVTVVFEWKTFKSLVFTK